MVALAADQGWFNLKVEGGPDFGVYQLKGQEQFNKPYEFELELVSRDSTIDLLSLLGSSALLTIADHSGGQRLVHGQIRKSQQLHTANAFTHYRIIIVPRLWFLSQNCNHRIFQDKTVPEIIETILKEQRFLSDAYELKLKEKYEPREYCVQYGESDLYFINRLCEEEGIYFYFAHEKNSHTVYFSDASGGPGIPGESDLRFYPGSGQAADTAVIKRLNVHSRVNSDMASYREWNFEKPALDLETFAKEDDPQKAPAPGGLNLENYQYPHLYQLKKPGDRYADIQLKRQLTFTKWVQGEGDVSRLMPGFIFNLSAHPREDANAKWWLTEVHHFGEQPQVLEHEAPDRGFLYQSRFTAIAEETRFIPKIEHHKIRILGQQTAIVTGPDGEEIYPDQYGRVKVEFHWDRRDLSSEKSSCWVRVSQGWAGSQYGTMAIPRIGHEVVVSFLEGDPDRPLITGRVYHAENMPPYELAKNKTRTVFKSLSSPGGGGFNELKVEDKKGEEEIYVHAEKDLNAHVKNDWKEEILHDQHRTVDNFSYSHVKGEDHQTVDAPRKVELMSSDHLTIHSDSHTEVKNKWLGKAGQEIHLKAGIKMVLEAGSELTIKAGGQFIRLNPAGIFTSVPFRMGSGSPGNGSGAAPLLPEKVLDVGSSSMPILRKFPVLANLDNSCLKNFSQTGALGKTETAADLEFDQHFKLVGAGSGLPIENIKYKIETEGGEIKTGKSNSGGGTETVDTGQESKTLKIFIEAEQE